MFTWTSPGQGIWSTGAFPFLYQVLTWLMSQAAPVLLLMFAAALAGWMFVLIKRMVLPGDEHISPYFGEEEEWEEDEE
jgi:hypothetical protein